MTSVLGAFRAAETLAVPGGWGTAERMPAHAVTFHNRWGTPLGRQIPTPLWSPDGID